MLFLVTLTDLCFSRDLKVFKRFQKIKILRYELRLLKFYHQFIMLIFAFKCVVKFVFRSMGTLFHAHNTSLISTHSLSPSPRRTRVSWRYLVAAATGAASCQLSVCLRIYVDGSYLIIMRFLYSCLSSITSELLALSPAAALEPTL